MSSSWTAAFDCWMLWTTDCICMKVFHNKGQGNQKETKTNHIFTFRGFDVYHWRFDSHRGLTSIHKTNLRGAVSTVHLLSSCNIPPIYTVSYNAPNIPLPNFSKHRPHKHTFSPPILNSCQRININFCSTGLTAKAKKNYVFVERNGIDTDKRVFDNPIWKPFIVYTNI